MDTKCYAIDHWKGDVHSALYGDEVFDRVYEHNKKFYSEYHHWIEWDIIFSNYGFEPVGEEKEDGKKHQQLAPRVLHVVVQSPDNSDQSQESHQFDQAKLSENLPNVTAR